MMRRVRVRSCVVVIVVAVVALRQRRRRADCGRRRARARLRARHRAATWVQVRSPVTDFPRSAPAHRVTATPGNARRPAVAASCSPDRSRPSSRAAVTPLPGIVGVPVRAAPGRRPPGRACRVRSGSTAPRRSRPERRSPATFVVDTATPRDGGPGVLVVPRCALPGVPLPAEPPTAARDLAADAVAAATRARVTTGHARVAGHREPREPLLDATARRRARDGEPRRLRRRRRRASGRVRVGARRRHDRRSPRHPVGPTRPPG